MLPTLSGQLWAERPIFSFWIALAISWLAGQVNEWTVRLPSALSALVLSLVYCHFLRKHFAAQVALLSTVVVASSLLMFSRGATLAGQYGLFSAVVRLASCKEACERF